MECIQSKLVLMAIFSWAIFKFIRPCPSLCFFFSWVGILYTGVAGVAFLVLLEQRMRILQRPLVCRVSIENENFLRSQVSMLKYLAPICGYPSLTFLFVNIFPFPFRKSTYPRSASLSSLLDGISVMICRVQIILFFLQARTV